MPPAWCGMPARCSPISTPLKGPHSIKSLNQPRWPILKILPLKCRRRRKPAPHVGALPLDRPECNSRRYATDQARGSRRSVALQKGNGKGMSLVWLARLGPPRPSYLERQAPVGNFNVHLRDCVMLFADEAFCDGDKQHESVLKTLIPRFRMAASNWTQSMKQAIDRVNKRPLD
jgi:hypothetical protein